MKGMKNGGMQGGDGLMYGFEAEVRKRLREKRWILAPY